jgi:hypothetical protein
MLESQLKYRRDVDRSMRTVEAENGRQVLTLAIAMIGLAIGYYSRDGLQFGRTEGYVLGAGLIVCALSVLCILVSFWASIQAHRKILLEIDNPCYLQNGYKESDRWIRALHFLSHVGYLSFAIGGIVLLGCVMQRVLLWKDV